MASFVIEGGHSLSGDIHPQGAKNEALQIICATLLTAEEVTVHNIPDILDVNNLIQLMRDMGVSVSKKDIGTYTFKAEKPDLILLDVMLPKMNGFVTFQRMKEFVEDVPVIFLTASGLEGDVVSAIKMGAVNYLKKPFQPQELMKRISQELKKQ